MRYMRHMIHTRETQQLVTFLGRARVDFQFFLKKSYVFICFIDIASWNCWNYTVFGRISICARGGRAHVHFVLFFARDDGPGTCATVVAEVRKAWKSCSQKPFSQKCLKSGGFPRNPQERAGWDFDNFCLKNHWVFDVFMLKSLRNLRFWKDFVLRARMCTSSHFLQGILENAGAQTLLKQFKSCSQKPFSQKCLKSGGFSTNPQERAGGDFDNFLLKNHWVF